MAREIYIDRDECTSCEECVDRLPEVFAMDEDNISNVLDHAAAAESEIQEAIDNCTGECIHWKEPK